METERNIERKLEIEMEAEGHIERKLEIEMGAERHMKRKPEIEMEAEGHIERKLEIEMEAERHMERKPEIEMEAERHMRRKPKIEMEEKLCAYWLCCIQEIGNKKKNSLLKFFGSPAEVFRAFDRNLSGKTFLPAKNNFPSDKTFHPAKNNFPSDKTFHPAKNNFPSDKTVIPAENSSDSGENFANYLIKHIPDLQQKDVNCLVANHDMDLIKRQYELMEKRGIFFVYQEEKRYPARLKNIDDAPLGLFFKGKLPSENVPAVAVVGARSASREGQAIARRFGRELAERGIQVISGMARGVDIAAQRGALEGEWGNFRRHHSEPCTQRGALEENWGGTWAVLGNGVDICYPRQNIEEFMLIQERGGLISEYPPGSPSLPWHFPMRNRIISGLSDGILVVEARAGSGSLITAETGLEQGREIFVVPGNILDGRYEGGNELLKSGACPVTDIRDILDGLGLFYEEDVAGRKKKNEVMLEITEKIVYANLGLEPVHISVLVEKTNLKLQEVMEILLGLQLKKLVSAVGNNYFVTRL